MNLKILIALILVLTSIKTFSQTADSIRKPDYLSLQTGLMVDKYNSLGIRIFFEYQKEIKGNWEYGISYENSTHLSSAATDHINELSTNLSLLSLNGYYKLNLYKDRIFWITGLGIGGVHANWNTNNKIGATINASMTLNIRMTKKLYFESSPLIVVLPTNRVYFSTMNADSFNNFYAFTLFPFGFKVKL